MMSMYTAYEKKEIAWSNQGGGAAATPPTAPPWICMGSHLRDRQNRSRQLATV